VGRLGRSVGASVGQARGYCVLEDACNLLHCAFVKPAAHSGTLATLAAGATAATFVVAGVAVVAAVVAVSSSATVSGRSILVLVGLHLPGPGAGSPFGLGTAVQDTRKHRKEAWQPFEVGCGHPAPPPGQRARPSGPGPRRTAGRTASRRTPPHRAPGAAVAPRLRPAPAPRRPRSRSRLVGHPRRQHGGRGERAARAPRGGVGRSA
jgi:hypothetical protein